MARSVCIVPQGHGSRWLDAEMLERVFARRPPSSGVEREPEGAVPRSQRPPEPLRYRPFEGLARWWRTHSAA